MRSPRSAQRGVTLIELVIAISLVALLSVGMLFAMRVGFVAMDHSKATLMANRRVVSVQRILEGEVANLIPIPTQCGTTKIGFLQGEAQSLRFVSSYSLHEGDRGLPQVLEFQVIPGQNGAGVRLVVNERVYTGPLSTAGLCLGIPPGSPSPSFRPIETGPLSFVLADKIAYCRFSFKEHLPPYGQGQWLAQWNKPFFPVAIRVEMTPLDPSAGHLQLVTLTMPVRINRDPLVHYDQ